MRPIGSTIGSPKYNLAMSLSKSFKNLPIPQYSCSVENSAKFKII